MKLSTLPYLCLLLLAAVGVTHACTCAPITQLQAICNAKWISHVKVEGNGTADGGAWHTYEVKHVEKFKQPTGEGGTKLELDEAAQSTIRTPSASPMCGVGNLEAGKEYLLAGGIGKAKSTGSSGANSTSGGESNSTAVEADQSAGPTLTTNTCFIIPLGDKQMSTNPMEWQEVAKQPELKKKLDEAAKGALKCQP